MTRLYAGCHQTVGPAAILVSSLPGQYRRDCAGTSGGYPNEQWLMETVFRRTAEAAR